MKASLTYDNKFIRLSEYTPMELEQLKLSFTRKIPNWYIIKKKMPWVNEDSCFINEYGFIPTGLWALLVTICQKYNFNLQFDEEFNCKIKNCSITFEKYKEYIDTLFEKSEKIKPYNHQLEGAYRLIGVR